MNRQDLRFAILAVDAAVITVMNRVPHVLLMAARGADDAGRAQALPGGLIRPDETAEHAVARHLLEKCGIEGFYIEQLGAFSEIERDPSGRVVSVAYLVLIPEPVASAHRPPDGITWRDADKIGVLAYDHNEILAAAIERLRAKLQSTTIARHLVAPHFTLSELQNVYESVLGRPLDKRNFRKKLIADNIVRTTGKKRSAVGRPSELFRFAGSKVTVIGILSGS